MYLLDGNPDPEKVDLSDERGENFYPFFNYNIINDYNELSIPSSNNIDEGSYLDNKRQWFKNKTYNSDTKNLYNPLFRCQSFNEEISNIRSRSIKLILSQQTKNILNNWSNLYRYAYNKAVGIFKETGLTGRSALLKEPGLYQK